MALLMEKTVIITGTSSGIGKEASLFFSEKGWNVVATMRNPNKRKTELKNKDGIDCIHLDVLDEKSIGDAIKFTLKKYKKIDVVVNNAGYSLFGPFEASKKEQVKKQFDTNVLGLMNVTREILPTFRKQRNGVIINVSSAAGRMTFPFYSLYNSTKWAVEGFSESLQFELRQFNIKIKIIEPGIINTEFYAGSKVIAENQTFEDYKTSLNKMIEYEKRNIEKKNYSHPRVVAETIYKAAIDESWKMRYKTGKYAGTIITLRRLFPDPLFFGIIRRLALK